MGSQHAQSHKHPLDTKKSHKVKSLFPAPALKSLNCCVSQMHLEPHKADFLGTLDESSHSLPATSHHTVDPNCGLRFLLVVEPDAQEASANSHCLFKGKAIPGKFPQVTLKIIHKSSVY